MDFRELCNLLSDYFDHDLDSEICSEIEEFICADNECRTLFNTFQETIHLSQEIEEIEVPQEVHIKLYRSLRITIVTEEDTDLY